MDKVVKFIETFWIDGRRPKVFIRNSYWFAYILKGRFPNGKILFNPVREKFYFSINEKRYNITGDMTNNVTPEQCVAWSSFFNKDLKKDVRNRLILKRKCINTDEVALTNSSTLLVADDFGDVVGNISW